MGSILSATRKLLNKLSGNAVLNIYNSLGICADSMVCQFNPEEYKIKTNGKFFTQERRENDSPILQYIGGSVSVLNLSLFFDTSASTETKIGLLTASVENIKATDVSAYTNKLLSLVKIDPKLHRPPIVGFSWGSLNFDGFVSNVEVEFIMFEKGGMPVRAKVNLIMQSQNLSVVGVEAAKKENPKQSPDRTKCRILTEDTSIWGIAQLEYDDAGKWREIARANNILDPMKIEVGRVLKVPALDL